MPEGDTIHRAARQLRDALAGRRVVRVEIRRDARGLRAPETGIEVTDVEARGKHLLVHFGDGAVLHTHMQMTGAWHVYQPGARWRRPGHRARAIIETDDGTTAVCFDAPVVELRRASHRHATGSTHARRTLERLGPDLCVAGVDLDAVMAALATIDTREPTAEIADVLLDQRVASGIGNVFKSEICWTCRVHPRTPIAVIDVDTRRELYEVAHRLMFANANTTRRATLAGGLAVYRRAGRPCPRCRTRIAMQKTGAGVRSTYWCPSCQPEPAALLGRT